MQQHILRIVPPYFSEVKQGFKTFEVRYNDRGFNVHDILILQEWLPGKEKYSGREIKVIVCSIVYGPKYGIEQGYCIMSIRVVE